MDRLRKRLEQFRVKVRAFVKYNWHNEPEGDKFRSLDILFVLGAVHYRPTSKWRRICWNAYSVLSVCSLLIVVLHAMDKILERLDLAKTIWHATAILAACVCLVKDLILNRNLESIQIARNFLNGKPFKSGDSLVQTINDEACRMKCFQRLQLIALVFNVMVVVNQVVFIVPSSGIDEFIGIPRILQYLGPTIAGGIHFLFLLTAALLWINKYCAGTGIICSLLFGFNTEYEIFVRGFDNILDNVYSDLEEEFPSTSQGTSECMRFQRDQLYWQYLKQRVNDQVKLHVQFAENLQLLEPAVKLLFGVIYYHAMVFISPIIYVLMTNGWSGASFLLVSAIVTDLLDCYTWCRIIDSLKDSNEKLEHKITDLITKVPYSQFHCKKYAEMRTTLYIVKTFVRNHEPFSCGGVFPISVEAFTELLHIGYTVFTFLWNIGKKHLKTHRSVKRKQKF